MDLVQRLVVKERFVCDLIVLGYFISQYILRESFMLLIVHILKHFAMQACYKKHLYFFQSLSIYLLTEQANHIMPAWIIFMLFLYNAQNRKTYSKIFHFRAMHRYHSKSCFLQFTFQSSICTIRIICTSFSILQEV